MSRFLDHRFTRLLRRHIAVALLIVAIVTVCLVIQRDGHDWGDDFSLYLRQSQALVEGNIGQVLADNRFTVLGSSSNSFSPLSYPWGTPILLAPVVAVWGIDFGMLKMLETLFFAGFLVALYALVQRRAGRTGGFMVVALVGVSWSFIGWTDTVLSEFPYLLFVGITLLALDRLRSSTVWETGSTRPLVVVGLLIGFTYNIRREGVALLLALAAVQAGYLLARRKVPAGSARLAVSWRRLATPYWWALGLVVGLQAVLPTSFLQRYENTGLENVGENVLWFRDILAEHIGLKAAGEPGLSVFGSATVALSLLLVFLVLVGLGLVIRMLNHRRDDAPIAAFMIGSAAVVAILPFHEGRYLMAISPFLAYFAYQGLASTLRDALIGLESRVVRAIPATIASAFLALFIASNTVDVVDRTAYRLEYDHVHWGPEDPAAQEMFEAVRQRTRRDDVLAFFRARAMNLFTDRRTLQLNNRDHVLNRVDWYVMEKGSTYSQLLLTPEEGVAMGLVIEWENDRFVLWEVPARAD